MEMMEQYSTNLTSSIAETVKKAVEDATRNLAIETSTSTHQPESQATNATATGGVQIGRWREYSGFAVPADFKFPSVTLRQAWAFYLLGFPSNRSRNSSNVK